MLSLSLSPFSFSRLLLGTITSCSSLSTVFVRLISLCMCVCQQGINPGGKMGFGGRGGGKGKGKSDGKGKGNRYEEPIPDYVTGLCRRLVCMCARIFCVVLLCVCVSMRLLSPRSVGRSVLSFLLLLHRGWIFHAHLRRRTGLPTDE